MGKIDKKDVKRMQTLTDQILSSILLRMEESDKTISSYKDILSKRLSFFYSLILQSLVEANDIKNLKQVINDITNFEISELPDSLDYAEDFKRMTPELTLQDFSILSYKLARCRMDGNSYSTLAYLVRELYTNFLGNTVFDDQIKKDYEDVISDTLLDLSFASNQSEIISLRILHYRDSI